MDDASLRRTALEMLAAKSAHVDPETALAGLPPGLRGRRPPGGAHSVWELLEHTRIAQRDILHYALDPAWRSPPWPEGYWPDATDPVPDAVWTATLEGFREDLAALEALARDETRDLTAAIPHGEGRTWLRQILLAATHTSYHLGQIVDVRRALGAWPPG